MSTRNAAEMQKTFKLPLLPGQTCGEELLRTNFRKTQLLSGTGEARRTVKDVPIDFDSTAVAATAAVGRVNGGTVTSPNATTTSSLGSPTDSLEKKVLRFFGYFVESVTESAAEKSRVRRVTLCYFLEDDTISVSEPRQDNSGISFQGTMVKRHQIPRQDSDGAVHFSDIAVGSDVSFYGRTFHIIDCDGFTREFMAAVGLDMAPAEELPTDAYNESRKPKAKTGGTATLGSTNSAGAKVKLSASEVRAAKQFFDKDRQVLRLKAVWDDTKSLYGEKHYFTMYYFLADDTIELVEDAAANSGRDPFPSFCRRQRILKSKPKRDAGLTIGQKDSNQNEPFYSDADLRIGATITIFGRDFLVYDYDKFTRDWLKEKFNVTEYNPIHVAPPPKPTIKREPPPYNGYGSEEDSLVSWRSLDMKPPRKSNEGWEKFGDATVKYTLKLVSGNPNDDLRRFVLTCFLADGTIAIFETVQRNSGILGGKFLQRQKVVNSETGKPFDATDFHIGCKTQINKFVFEVVGTDERSLAFMEENSSSFPKSNINAVVSKIQAMLLSSRTGLENAFLSADRNGTPLDVANLTRVFADRNLDICEHEVMTLLRYFERNGDVNLNYEILVSRLLDMDDAASSIDQEWEAIYRSRTSEGTEGLSHRDRVEMQHRKVEATTAAYAARYFLEQYQNRRHLFHTEFKFVTDYAIDNKIGEAEFRHVVQQKLQLNLSQAQVDALAKKVFPSGSRRVTFEEFLRILNNNSNYDHNMSQIKDRRE